MPSTGLYVPGPGVFMILNTKGKSKIRLEKVEKTVIFKMTYALFWFVDASNKKGWVPYWSTCVDSSLGQAALGHVVSN